MAEYLERLLRLDLFSEERNTREELSPFFDNEPVVECIGQIDELDCNERTEKVDGQEIEWGKLFYYD